ncbi:MAG: alpha/beta hydrolase [Mobilicoccus sp.]|nr:alpha/beta hydrolase [Mobilicoccus sp.]
MATPTRMVPFGDGEVAVRDYGGQGAPVLLVHSLGMCAVNWDEVGPVLARSCRVFAIDLPGHGASTARMRTPEAVYECILTVVRALELPPTLLVGHDQGGLCMVEAVTAAPELFTGGVAIGGTISRTRAEMEELCELAASDFFIGAMRTRFLFGARGHGEEAALGVIDHVVANASFDWILQDIDGLRREREYSLRTTPDGSWVHAPDPEDVAMVGRFSPDSPLYPTQDRIPGFAVPVWILQLTQGQDVQFAERERALAARHDLLRLITLDSGQWPQYSQPQQLAEILAAIAADPTRAET